MDILNITFTESGNQATLRTDRGYFDMTRADLMEFLQKFLGEDVRSAVRPGAELDFLPLFVDDEAEGELEALTEKLKAIKYASYILGIGDKSEKQLRTKLKTKGYSTRAIDEAFDVLRRNGYICDERTCKRKCELLANGKLFGRRRIISELMAKGYPYSLCEATVDEQEIDFEANLALLYEKISKGENLLDWEQKKKISDKLLRYGYSYDEINCLFDGIISEDF